MPRDFQERLELLQEQLHQLSALVERHLRGQCAIQIVLNSVAAATGVSAEEIARFNSTLQNVDHLDAAVTAAIRLGALIRGEEPPS